MMHTNNKYLLFLIAIIVCYSCDINELDEPISDDELANFLSFEADVDSSQLLIPLINLTATIPEGVADPLKRVVIFSTNKGEFVSAAGGKSMEVTADVSGTAKAIVNTNNETGQFVLSVILKADSSLRKTEIETVGNNRDSLFSLVASPDTLKANGLDYINISIILNKDYDPDVGQSLTLEHNITGGTFEHSVDPKKLQLSLLASETKARIQVGTAPGSYSISAQLDALSLKKSAQVVLQQLQPEEVFEVLSMDSSGLLADGEFLTTISIRLANTPSKFVVLSSTLGRILDVNAANASINANNELTFRYELSAKVKEHLITMKVSHEVPIIKTISLNPSRSLPEEIFLTADKYAVDTSELESTILILAIATIKEKGIVSEDTPITIKAFQMIDGNRHEVGIFNNLFASRTDSVGKISDIQFRPLPSTLKTVDTDIIFRAEGVNQDGVTIEDEITVAILKK